MKRLVCVFCGSSLGKGAAFARMAEDVARTIVRAGYGVVYGGGSIGLMGVLADAALREGGEVVGIIPRALASAEIAHAGLTRLELVEGMHERKARMLELSDALIALPGAFGTMDELCEVLSWRQLGIHSKPVGLLDFEGYYRPLVALFDAMVVSGFLTPANRQLLVVAGRIGALLEQMQLTPAQ